MMGNALTRSGLILAAPSSGSGKTVVTLGLLAALKRDGVAASSLKAGPDYIDPVFHACATGRPCYNLDPWAMRGETTVGALMQAGAGADLLVVEGVMGLFDGAANGSGSTADLAAMTGWPVVLVVDVKGQAASAAAVISGFAKFRHDINVAGVILNRVGSARHKQMIVDACAKHLPDIPIMGAVRRSDALLLPERHLGLVQAGEHPELEAFLDRAADIIAEDIDLDAFVSLTKIQNAPTIASTPEPALGAGTSRDIAPLGQHIAVARDAAFAFSYSHLLDGWQRAGAEISFFSPLADEAPHSDCDAIYLPGGYPELDAANLASVAAFKPG